MRLNCVVREREVEVGRRLWQEREKAGLSRAKVLERIYNSFGFYIPECVYERLENCKSHPKAVYVLAICAVLSIDSAVLMSSK